MKLNELMQYKSASVFIIHFFAEDYKICGDLTWPFITVVGGLDIKVKMRTSNNHYLPDQLSLSLHSKCFWRRCNAHTVWHERGRKKNRNTRVSQLMYHHLSGFGLELLEYFTSLHDLLFLLRSWILFITQSFWSARLYNITQFIFWSGLLGERSALRNSDPPITQSQYLKGSKELFNARRR